MHSTVAGAAALPKQVPHVPSHPSHDLDVFCGARRPHAAVPADPQCFGEAVLVPVEHFQHDPRVLRIERETINGFDFVANFHVLPAFHL